MKIFSHSSSFSFVAAIAVGLLFVILGLPLILSKIPQNNWYGVRTGKTLSDVGLWYTANNKLGYAMVCVGGGILSYLGVLLVLVVRKYLSLISALNSLPIALISAIGILILWLCYVLASL